MKFEVLTPALLQIQDLSSDALFPSYSPTFRRSQGLYLYSQAVQDLPGLQRHSVTSLIRLNIQI